MEPNTATSTDSDHGLHRTLGVSDIVIVSVAGIIGIQWLATAAQMGPSSILLWLLAVLIFFIPLCFTVIELSSRLPSEGGIYVWTKAAFGDTHGFLVGWAYWVNNVFFFPSLLLLIAGAFLYIFGDRWADLENSAAYNLIFSLLLIWTVIWVNIIGVKRGEWVAVVGVVGCIGCFTALLLAGALQYTLHGSATNFSVAAMMPDTNDFSTLTFFATMTFAFAGIEMATSMGGEIKSPRRTIPRAIVIAGVVITLVYIVGTAMLMIGVSAEQINVVTGLSQAFSAIGDNLGLAWLGSIGALLFAMSVTGGLGAWVTSVARIPYVIGIDSYLPSALGKTHPRYGTPHIALLTQGVVVSLVLLAASIGATVEEAYIVMLDLSIILYFTPNLYLFAALPVLRRRANGNNEGVQLVPFGDFGPWLFGGLGFAATLLSVVLAFIPPAGTVNPGLFILKIVGGTFLFIVIGFAFYLRNGISRTPG